MIHVRSNTFLNGKEVFLGNLPQPRLFSILPEIITK